MRKHVPPVSSGLGQREGFRPGKVWPEARADAQFAAEPAAERGNLLLLVGDLDRTEMDEVVR